MFLVAQWWKMAVRRKIYSNANDAKKASEEAELIERRKAVAVG